MLRRIGIDIPRATLCLWVIRAAELFKPMMRLIHKNIIDYVENVVHNFEQLIAWMHDQGQVHFSQINGEIIDNNTHRIVKNIQYDPLECI
jgi:hypothetical protein